MFQFSMKKVKLKRRTLYVNNNNISIFYERGKVYVSFQISIYIISRSKFQFSMKKVKVELFQKYSE